MNTNAIDKILKELVYRDYIRAWKQYPKSFIDYYRGYTNKKPRKYYPFSYVFGSDTEEALSIKKDYINGNIDENEYKAYCLKFNLLNREADNEI